MKPSGDAVLLARLAFGYEANEVAKSMLVIRECQWFFLVGVGSVCMCLQVQDPARLVLIAPSDLNSQYPGLC